MKELFDGKTLVTTKDLAAVKFMSISKQAEERAAGRLGHIRIGRRVLYSEQNIKTYIALCEHSGQEVSGAEA